jgi:hypothetical protein
MAYLSYFKKILKRKVHDFITRVKQIEKQDAYIKQGKTKMSYFFINPWQKQNDINW